MYRSKIHEIDYQLVLLHFSARFIFLKIIIFTFIKLPNLFPRLRKRTLDHKKYVLVGTDTLDPAYYAIRAATTLRKKEINGRLYYIKASCS